VSSGKFRQLVTGTSVLLWLFFWSCGTDTVVRYDYDGYEAPVGDGVVFGENHGGQEGDVYLQPKPDHYKPSGGIRYMIIPKHDTTKPLSVMVGTTQKVMAQVIDFELGMPAINYPVKYTIAGANPACEELPQCGHFKVKEGMTDGLGNVTVTFVAGEVGEVLYTTELSGEDAEPAVLDIDVHDPPAGTLKVKLQYDGPITIKNVKVRVLHGFKTCADYNPVHPWVEGLDGEKTVTGVDSVPTFSPLLTAETYLVFATAEKKDSGHLAASGCTDAVHIKPDEQGETVVTLNLYVLTLNPAGTYDTVNHFDFTDAIPGQAGEIISFVVDLFYDPGKIIIDLIKELIAQYVGSWITDIAFSLFEDALADVVTNWLLNNSPDFIQDFFVVGQDLVQIVKNVELTSLLVLSKLTNDYYFQGIQNWVGINLYWKLGCDPDDPGYDECGKYPFSLEELQDSDVPIDLIQGQFTGMIANYDNLIIDTHKIDLNYGKLILFVINEILLPAISGYNSLEDLLYSIIDCQSVADGIIGDVLSAIGIDEDDVEGACTSVVSFIVSPIEELISGLTFDSKLRIHGKCIMLDEDDDLLVDRLLEGRWWGHVEMGGDEGAEFEGDFEAVKAQYPGQ